MSAINKETECSTEFNINLDITTYFILKKLLKITKKTPDELIIELIKNESKLYGLIETRE